MSKTKTSYYPSYPLFSLTAGKPPFSYGFLRFSLGFPMNFPKLRLARRQWRSRPSRAQWSRTCTDVIEVGQKNRGGNLAAVYWCGVQANEWHICAINQWYPLLHFYINYGQSWYGLGKLTSSMAILNSYVSHYQWVDWGGDTVYHGKSTMARNTTGTVDICGYSRRLSICRFTAMSLEWCWTF